jgi:AbiJ N-terminal domain 3/Abortive infection C-terminus
MTNLISEVTRRNIFDALRLREIAWEGRLSECAFLSRIFDLTTLPSHDHRARTMLEDVALHRGQFHDWGDDWPYEDGRLNLLRGPDDLFVRFLSETIHPLVREDDALVDELLLLFNRQLLTDGFHLCVVDVVSGKRIFGATQSLDAGGHADARKIADELASDHVNAQLARMQDSIVADPALAIGSAKEFVESICKGILTVRGVALTGKEDLPRLVHQAREKLGIAIDREASITLRSTLGALATLTQGVAELRGQLGTGHGGTPDAQRPPIAVARLAVGVARTLGVFLWDAHRDSWGPTEAADPESSAGMPL